MTSCHHHVEGSCPVCNAVERIKRNPPAVAVRLLHLKGGSGPLCGDEVTEGMMFSTLEAHDEERFCPLCVVRQRALERERAKAALQAWKSRRFKEKKDNFHAMLMGGGGDFNAPFMFIFRLFAVGGLVTVATLATVTLGWSYAAFLSVVYLYAVWRFGVALS